MLVRIFKLEQRSPDYLRLNPLGKVLLNLLTGSATTTSTHTDRGSLNHQVPLLVEHDGFALPESCGTSYHALVPC